MGSVSAGIVLDLKLCAARTVGGFLKEAAAALDTGDCRMEKLEQCLRSLEEESKKIEAFKRELPLCMLILADVIDGLKKERERCRGEKIVHAFEEFIPIRSECEEGGVKQEVDCKDKMNWMSSAQLWSDNSSEEKNDDERKIAEERKRSQDRREEEENLFLESKSREDPVVPFKGISTPAMKSKEEAVPRVVVPDLSLVSPAVKNASCSVSAVAEDYFGGGLGQSAGRVPVSAPAAVGAHLSLQVQQQLQPSRKARRCWSQELHRKFVQALQQLGGAQVATPKQIRDLMKVDGLTNDEVKSHLQKYRLHTRKAPNASAAADRPHVVLGSLWVPPEDYTTSPKDGLSQSGSPLSPLQLAGANRAISATAGDSCEEEDEKSETYNWR
ncbi:hypothetical protein Cni_G00353 [Canna indica]|uniref:HTH myb-type domain-containing protein n=1 Tax=Canna indica TaxID=4628 RepID=A0AAQ3JL62_9LILI|nr:hypothetical protein Cni_G00353 [Canna indica]